LDDALIIIDDNDDDDDELKRDILIWPCTYTTLCATLAEKQ